MRRLGPSLTAVLLATSLAACGKPSTTPAPAAGDTQAAAPAAPAADAPDPKATLAKLPAPYNTADLENGATTFALCASCHTTTQGAPNMTGPNLYGVFGRRAGSLAGFAYSDPMKAAGWTWDAAHLDTWITNPKAVLPGTKMTFAGLKDPKARTDVIAYLMVMTGFKP